MGNTRRWTTPLLTGAFILLSVTGIMMFFHHASGLAKVIHEWLGWLLVGAGIVHMGLNARPLLTMLKRPVAAAVVAIFAVVTLVAVVLPAQQRQFGPPGRPAASGAASATGGATEAAGTAGRITSSRPPDRPAGGTR